MWPVVDSKHLSLSLAWSQVAKFPQFFNFTCKRDYKAVQHARRRVFYSSDLRPFVTPVSVADKARSEVTILTFDLTLTWHVTF